MATHGRERLKAIKALAELAPYKGRSAMTAGPSFKGWGRYPQYRDITGQETDEQYPVAYDTADVVYWVYSYATPIAWVNSDGTTVIPDIRYSVTTAYHQNMCRVYLNNLRNAAPWIERL